MSFFKICPWNFIFSCKFELSPLCMNEENWKKCWVVYVCYRIILEQCVICLAEKPLLKRMGQNFDQAKRNDTFWPMPNILTGVHVFLRFGDASEIFWSHILCYKKRLMAMHFKLIRLVLYQRRQTLLLHSIFHSLWPKLLELMNLFDNFKLKPFWGRQSSAYMVL